MVGEGVYYMHAIFGRLLYIGVLVYGLVVNNYGVVKLRHWVSIQAASGY